MNYRSILPAAAVAAGLHLALPAHGGYAPAPGYHTRALYDTAGSFAVAEGLFLDDGIAYFGQGTALQSLDLLSLHAHTEGALPGSVTAAFVARLDDTTYTAYGTSFSPPFPYTLGFLQPDGVYTQLVTTDGVFDAAVNGAGVLHYVANPGATGSRLYRLDLPAGTPVEIANLGGFSGGLTFDAADNLYYAYQAPFPGPSQVIRFTAAQVATGGLTLSNATVVATIGASYLDFDEAGNLYATTGFGNSLGKYDVTDGHLIDTAVTDDTGGFGIGKFMWDHEANRLIQVYSDFGTFSSMLYELIPSHVRHDFDRDGLADIAVYNSGTGTWSIRESENPGLVEQQWGWSEVLPVPGDYDGDSRTDMAVFWPETGLWYVKLSSGGAFIQQWGWDETEPVPADYDGDGKTDLAVYHEARGDWYIRRSSDEGLFFQNWGFEEAEPVPADYDGDGTTDLAVHHRATGDWFIRRSSDTGLQTQHWGWSETRPIPADYDGDGRDDIAVYHPTTGDWYIQRSSDGSFYFENWGFSTTLPVADDFDGDGRADLAAYHRGSGDWTIHLSRDGSVFSQHWGWSAVLPLQAP